MIAAAELTELLSHVTHNRGYNAVDGLDPFRHLLDGDSAPAVRGFLERELPDLESRIQSAIAFVLAEHLFREDDLPALQRQYASDHAEVKQGTLGALTGKPRAGSETGPGVVRLALEGCSHPAPGVRAEACRVLMNQCAWKIEVSEGREPLLALLSDPNAEVQQAATAAVGHLALHKYDMTPHILPLCANLAHEKSWMQDISAWALWSLSRARHDVSAAVPPLLTLLWTEQEWNGPQRRAAGALLHYAKKSAANAAALREALREFDGRPAPKEAAKLLSYLLGSQQ